ncbi:TIM barrel protein [Paenibacillus doosanensis]|uniref:Xylose isomerase-like TIM barrel n=1 Tax=Paenibacillus konkukensis TaxID=2020716 RepID=A0ABY4RZL8_9BACL|nr:MULTISPECIES: TIM barrel protein [Paenibacillus]MCS7458664.1 TIM barrel protein [Paenibacillus doosanensis]UQZ86812.1 Xylose isomerase-like TIM barrel [Paenibacillus konkukensis]
MAQAHKINDGSGRKPRLDIQQSWWAMNGVGNGEREWTVEEKFEKIAEAGFTGILSGIPAPEEQDRWHRLLEEYNLSFGTHAFPYRREDLTPVLRDAKQFGAQYVNAQVMDSFVIGDEAIRLLQSLTEEAAVHGVPFMVETHRARVTQDLHRTADYVNAIPGLRLTIDFSHYVVAGEMTHSGIIEKAEPLLDTLLRRTSALHGRVSNGEQVQVDIGPNGEHGMVEHYLRWWSKGIAYWLQEAQPGDVLPFVSELGPPGYAITSDGYSCGRAEISDRWQQALVFKRLAEEAWRTAAGEA